MKTFRIAMFVISAAVIACSGQTATLETPVVADRASATPAAREATSSPAPIPSAEPTSTPMPFVPFTVTTWEDNVVLRTNPGQLFTRLLILPDNTALTVLGRAPGGEWLLVKTADSRAGWVFEQLVESGGVDVTTAPLVEPTEVLSLRGRLLDADGHPISGVQFAVVQGTGDTAPRTDAMTDTDGVFHAFMPPDSRGSWWVSYVAISCESNVMDATCTNWTGEPDPKGMFVALPGGAYSALQFTWR